MASSLDGRGILLLTFSAALLCVTGCQSIGRSSVVTKTILVRPVDKGSKEVVDAIAEFLGAADHFRLADQNRGYDAPFAWHTEVDRSGGMRITWTSRRGAKERLFLSEAGFHLVEVPLDQALIIDREDTYSGPLRPMTLEMIPNTAFLPERARLSYRHGRIEERKPVGDL